LTPRGDGHTTNNSNPSSPILTLEGSDEEEKVEKDRAREDDEVDVEGSAAREDDGHERIETSEADDGVLSNMQNPSPQPVIPTLPTQTASTAQQHPTGGPTSAKPLQQNPPFQVATSTQPTQATQARTQRQPTRNQTPSKNKNALWKTWTDTKRRRRW